MVQTTTNVNTEDDKTSSDNVTSFNLDVSDNPYILTPPPIQSPPKTPELPPIVVGYNPRKIGRYNLRPNPRPNANPDFRMLDSVTTEDLRSTQDWMKNHHTKPNRNDYVKFYVDLLNYINTTDTPTKYISNHQDQTYKRLHQ